MQILTQKLLPVGFLVDESCVVYLVNKISEGLVSQNLISDRRMSTNKSEKQDHDQFSGFSMSSSKFEKQTQSQISGLNTSISQFEKQGKSQVSGLITSTSKSEESSQNMNSGLIVSFSIFEEQSAKGGDLRDLVVDVSWEQLFPKQFCSPVLMAVKSEVEVRTVD